MIAAAIPRQLVRSDPIATLGGDPGRLWPPKGITWRIRATQEQATAIPGRYSDELLEAGQANEPHRYPGPAFGYIVEGEYEWGIDDQPTKILKVGETFYEPAGCLHRVSKNPGKVKTRLLAWILHPRDFKDIAVPEKK